MKYNAFFLIFLILTISKSFAKETIIITGHHKIEHPLIYENKKIIIDKNTTIDINTDEEHVIYLKNSELFINGDILFPVTIKSRKINSEQNVFFIEDSKASIKNTIFENNGWCLHVHNSNIVVEKSYFKNNFGGIRFFNSQTLIKKNIFEANEIGMRFISSNNNDITHNIFFNNKTAIFIREGIYKNGIRENAFINNKYDFYAGFFQNESLSFSYNYFFNEPSIFDINKDKDLMAVINVYPILKNFPDWH